MPVLKGFSPNKLRPGVDICVDTTFNALDGCDYIARIVENPSETVVLEGVPPKRQMTVRPRGQRKTMVIDMMHVRRRV